MDDVWNPYSSKRSASSPGKSKSVENRYVAPVTTRTLNISKKSLSPDRSPSKYTVKEPISTKEYAKFPELDEIMLHYLDMEEILKRYEIDHTLFETQSALNTLATRFGLPRASSFKQLLRSYDTKYATVRSYFYTDLDPRKILIKAAEEGNIEAFYKGLILYPKYKNKAFLSRILGYAARSGSELMINLVKELHGGNFRNEKRAIMTGLAEGGHLEELKVFLEENEIPHKIFRLLPIVKAAIARGQLETLKYLVSITTVKLENWNKFLYDAGISGSQEVIEYVLSKGANNYKELLRGLVRNNHVDLALKYMNAPGINYESILKTAIQYAHNVELAKLIAIKAKRISKEIVDQLMEEIDENTSDEEIQYLISLGGDNYLGLLSTLAIFDNLELFKKYYKKDPNYQYILSDALKYGSSKVVKFMIDTKLVKTKKKNLNQYLEAVDTEDLETIELLFKLGATDYKRIVERAIKAGNLEVIKKYFDKADIDLNEQFQKAKEVEVYKYLLTKGEISQETLNNTLHGLSRFKKEYLIGLGAVEYSNESSTESD